MGGLSFIQYFHRGGKLPEFVTAYFLALVPKNNIPQSLEATQNYLKSINGQIEEVHG